MGKVFPAFILVSAIAAPAAAESGGDAWQGPDQPVYVVTQNHYAEGFSPEGGSARFTDLIMIEIHGGAVAPAQPAEVYPIGGHVNLYIRGERHGDVTIKKVASLQCDSSAAIVSTASGDALKKRSMALATNASNIHSHPNWSSKPDTSMNVIAGTLAAEELQKHGVKGIKLVQIKIQQLTVTAVQPDGPRYLIGALSFTGDGVEHDVFLIGQVTGSKAIPELVRYHEMKDLQDDTDVDELRFVDQLDLDNDGVDEVVLEETGYENEEFEIYKRGDGSWKQVSTGGEGGC